MGLEGGGIQTPRDDRGYKAEYSNRKGVLKGRKLGAKSGPGGELLRVASSQGVTVDATADTDSTCTQKRKH